MNRPGIAVTGMGLLTCAGDADATWAAVCRGESLATRVPQLRGAKVDFACQVQVDDLDDRVGRKVWRMGRFAKLAVLAARDAVRDAGLDPGAWDGSRVSVVIGCGIGGSDAFQRQSDVFARQGAEHVSPLTIPLVISNMAVGEVAIDLKAQGPSLATSTACASGASALALARDLLAAGTCDIAVVGGTEAAVTPLVVAGFYRMGALSTRGHDVTGASRPFAADRDGFVMGEGAGVLVLERAADARARGARVHALLAGCAGSTDAHHPTAPPPGSPGAEAALRQAARDAGVRPADIDHVNAHGTSTPLNDRAEAAVIARTLPHRPSVTSAKGVLGHTLGAAGAIEAVLTIQTLTHQTVPPTANLGAGPAFDIDCVTRRPRLQRVEVAVSHSFGFGGHNVVLVFSRP
ncbi:beta-ketoacyl-[acyl-carrier-protein] synthase family protein [Streptomyces ziwulingensis]|uniref:Beta-ketoacyl-[acyl-carrier-protein] synthase family protein n=1 Tax=Streptomyces ziwulingensis TaxID=1045501 RepID=A0ABP9CRX4_9ACTN